ncbi:CDP-glycerol glycerophosphotransferase family protein [Salinicoccus halodurans]|uniref:CDP-glycerol glycerophosphotransferase n=1 Tax=Salinicoccus halodurans TaxID=407035 RepID=A0A0F7HJB7_9STAP|nr:CDP-glycerol glycerophosphotransferase family protein [Salinicoccus halodurans]AKG73447.1 CDP-glycerol:glycerophosphate glycerophosphotransferase [Salinicoccus halodurans]SFK50660.1 CDP-glycerol glycerophosphotransferase [Salinicoccus halodurans]
MKYLKKAAFFLYKKLFALCGRTVKKDQSLIMFESFLGKQYSDNPRALYEYMSAHHPEYTLIWSADRNSTHLFEERNIPYVKRFSLPWMIHMNKATLWITNSRLPLWIPKPHGTTYLQTWHGTPLKKLGRDIETVHMPGTDTESYRRNFTKEASKWDYLISPNRYSTEIFRRAFGFDKTVLETGYPRNDFLFSGSDPKAAENIKEALGLPQDKKIILYAPTWRDDSFHARGRYKFDLQFDTEKMYRELSDDYIIILRMHYLVSENLDLKQYNGFLYDFSKHEDIRDLYVISDMLVTDYSSVFFDYATLGRPMIFYTYDIDQYRDKLRGFYFDFEANAPGPLVKTTDNLIEEIKHPDQSKFDLEAFRERFSYLEDGAASQRVMEDVVCHLKNKIV